MKDDGRALTPRRGLTARETEVTRAFGLGMTPTEVADALGIGRETVYTYRRIARRKIEALASVV